MWSSVVVVLECCVPGSEVFFEAVEGQVYSFDLSVGLRVFDSCLDVFGSGFFYCHLEDVGLWFRTSLSWKRDKGRSVI